MKKIYVMILFICLIATSSYGEQNYDAIIKKFEAALQQVRSYQIKQGTVLMVISDPSLFVV